LPRLSYYRRIFSAYLIGGKSHLTFWPETPAENPNAIATDLGEYSMLFAEKADHQGFYDSSGVPQLDYHGTIGLQYNPIAIAQYGLGNYQFCRTADTERRRKFFVSADWLCSHLEQNAQGLSVWNHHFGSLRLGIPRHSPCPVVLGARARAGNLHPGSRPERIA
jgi:hypothetical protein